MAFVIASRSRTKCILGVIKLIVAYVRIIANEGAIPVLIRDNKKERLAGHASYWIARGELAANG